MTVAQRRRPHLAAAGRRADVRAEAGAAENPAELGRFGVGDAGKRPLVAGGLWPSLPHPGTQQVRFSVS
ncbi:hypothetical protein [Deinococcus hopiensis]|uniref:hypothetical protein n=1 Tax=Deinococcus hopiensis TaxID=309885 RepID=UPI00111C9045|nr:hypothetical protein [Deinococcus hopiensis]